jgi:hypothetical protein
MLTTTSCEGCFAYIDFDNCTVVLDSEQKTVRCLDIKELQYLPTYRASIILREIWIAMETQKSLLTKCLQCWFAGVIKLLINSLPLFTPKGSRCGR